VSPTVHGPACDELAALDGEVDERLLVCPPPCEVRLRDRGQVRPMGGDRRHVRLGVRVVREVGEVAAAGVVVDPQVMVAGDRRERGEVLGQRRLQCGGGDVGRQTVSESPTVSATPAASTAARASSPHR
jgi:hypothetical protein